MKNQIQQVFIHVLKELGITDILPDVEISGDPKNGDYTTNVAMRIAAKEKGKRKKEKVMSPMEIALQVVEEVKSQKSKVKSETPDQNIKQKHQSGSAGIVENSVLQDIDHIEVAPPGFINIFLTEAKLSTSLETVLKEKESYGTVRPSAISDQQSAAESRKRKADSSLKVMVEFAHPNTHKAFHIGHLRNITTGESIVRLLESQGHEVIRANYQGDVGMHIAKALYALLQIKEFKQDIKNYSSSEEAKRPSREVRLGEFSPPVGGSNNKLTKERVEFLGKAYAAGSKLFEEDAKAKEMIKDINFLVYASAQRFSESKGAMRSSTDYLTFVHGRQDEIDEVYELWKETRQWSLDYFEMIYKRVGSHYDRYYFESECLGGVDLAKDAIKRGVLKESEGAIIFDGKPYGIDTRVFVNSLGLPTYEAKELALAQKETAEFGKLERIIHVVGPEQASFFTVTFKAEELLGTVGPGVQHHLIYGWVKLKHGKMSSRSGVVVLGEWLLDEAKKEIYTILQKSRSNYTKEVQDEIAEKAAVAAVKYSFLRVSTKNEIAFDLQESVNMEGDSGPYLQYTYARARSVLRKAGNSSCQLSAVSCQLNPEERELARLIIYFPEIVEDAAKNFAPSTLCTYLFNLAQAFNVFYAEHSILGESKVESVKSKVKNNKFDLSGSTALHSSRFTLDASLSSFRLALTSATAQVLKNGLYLLGIETLEQM